MTGDVAALVTVLGGIREELAGIRAAIELAVQLPAAVEPVAEAVGCQHPDECRVDFGGMGEDDEWECSEAKGGCGFHYPRDLLLKGD